MKRLALLLPLSLLAALPLSAPVTQPETVAVATASYQPALPVTATFFSAIPNQRSRVHPDKASSMFNDAEQIRAQVLDMQYGGMQVGIYDWFGRGSSTDALFPLHLRAADDNSFRWAILNEMEGHGRNPTAATAKADRDHLFAKYGSDPSFFRVGGKPVMFLYNEASDGCAGVRKWVDSRFYLVAKQIPSYTACSGPQSWFEYAPGFHSVSTTNAISVSPGFNDVRESRPRLARSVSRFAADLRAMKAAGGKRFKLVTTWNEWVEATGVESALEWRSGSGHGQYVDQMHSILGSVATVPPAPAGLRASVSGQSVTLAWGASSGASSYQVFRNGCPVATVSSPTYTDTSLTDASASYSVKAVNFRGTSRRGGVLLVAAGTPAAAPVSNKDGLVAMRGERIYSTTTGDGLGCGGRQRAQSVVTVPSSVPAGATGVVLTVTTANSLGAGTVQLFPAGASGPGVNQVRYGSKRAASNTTSLPIGTGRQFVVQETGNATYLTIDVIGYTMPGADGLELYTTPPDRLFYNSAQASLGGTATKKVGPGTVTYALPPQLPADASAVQVRLLVSGASAAGTVTVFNGTSTPPVTSLAYEAGAIYSTAVVVPVTAGRTISFTTTRSATIGLGLEGWAAPGGRTVELETPRRVLSTGLTTAATITFGAADYGRIALLNVDVIAARAAGNLSIASDGGSSPMVQTVKFDTQQGQPGLIWVRIPANGKVNVTMTQAASVAVDLVGIA